MRFFKEHDAARAKVVTDGKSRTVIQTGLNDSHMHTPSAAA